MKSFSKFLNEGVSPSERRRSPKEQAIWDDINKREAEKAAKKAQRGPTGAAARPDLQFKKRQVQSPASPKKPSGAARDPWKQFPKKPQQQMGLPKEGPSSRLPGRLLSPAPESSTKALPQGKKGESLAVKSSPQIEKTPSIKAVTVKDITPKQKALPQGKNSPIQQSTTSALTKSKLQRDAEELRQMSNNSKMRQRGGRLSKPVGAFPDSMGKGAYDAARKQTSTSKSSSGRSGGRPPVLPPSGTKSPSPSQGKPPAGVKPTGKFAKVGRLLGPASAALDTALSTADERSKGSGWGRSLAKGATVAAGGLAGGALGALGGGGIGSAALGTAGAIGGAELAGKAFDVAAGANAKERAAMAKANRQRQAGTAIKGIGGKTTFDTKKNTMTTGTGSQKKTVKLAKTGVVHRGGQSVAGHLAYKGGKAVYKAGPSAQSLAKTSSNPLERIGRTLFAGAYKKHDAAKAQQALQKARQSDAARNKKLGVKALPGK